MASEDFPFPGTPEARKHGCVCPEYVSGQGSTEEPYVLRRDCPLHGEAAFEEHQKGPRH
jgi:hypothetical protein